MSELTDAVVTTLHATIAPGEALGRGSERVYRRLAPAPGEPHLVREELSVRRPQELSSVLRFVHVTDYQLADLASPGRIDFVQRYADRAGWAGMVPAYRPQEIVSTHAFEAMARTVAKLASDPGAPVRFVLTTGDNTDNAQLNELRGFLALMHGGDTVDPTFGVAGSGETAAIPSYTVSGDYYNPEPESQDRYKREYGFPDRPGLLAAAAGPFRAQGFGVDWLACFGNHDCLAQGRAPVAPEFQDLLTGGRRPVAAPAELPPAPSDAYLADPTVLAGGPARGIEPRADRRLIGKAEYIRAHLDSPGTPRGHGFSEADLAEGRTHYCYDEIPGVRVIVLDSTNPAGHVTGSIGRRQRDWLERSLIEVHSAYRDAAGVEVRTGHRDRVVVLASHHGLDRFDNAVQRPDEAAHPDSDLPRVLGEEVEALLHRFGNVVLWLAGHQHLNSVTPRGRSGGGGFWHVITSGLCEWPSQARVLELLVGTDTLVIRSTMIDHAAPLEPGADLGLWDLAAAHRELSANEPTRVGGPESAGTVRDRNVDLLVPIGPALSAALRARDDGR
ncbi:MULTISPECIES: metallophosphoesterase family protein [Kitasatospora]|uniref:TIGR03767 family metallophosphoesterase n=1 Tax=Kitasatospora cathayae TaxID=3004092 RepID=A0ABY7PW98_9ACTN|nr:hypothetical protein [Kitasatospora sp. HUAS 3-15]WBP84715.1 hypothetical protein O1G21_01855 [Kitasatospora sp. HUAS 3-15]